MNELALFAGGGGGLLATKHLLGWRTVCYVENNPYRVKVLKARIKDGYLDDGPIWGDVRTFDGTPWRGCVDIVTAGFPCQPFSTAGKQQGEDDERNLWPETIRVIREAQPAIAFLENVPGLVSSGYIFTVLNDLAQGGYSAFPPVRLAASDVGANHKRERIWIVAYSNRGCCQGTQSEIRAGGLVAELCCENVAHTSIEGDRRLSIRQGRQEQETANAIRCREAMANTNTKRRNGRLNPQEATKPPGQLSPKGNSSWWTVEPQLGRVAHGVAHRVDRIGAIGDGQFPAVVSTVWKLLTEKENATQAHP